MLITQELLDYLEQKFPDKSPELNDNERTIWFKSGQSSVVKYLKQLKDEQSNNILSTSTIGKP
ncbi:MAG: uncultured phage MedDCM-OCT-S46-C10 [Pseudomonadota bacterium]|jgi:hypothetical protein